MVQNGSKMNIQGLRLVIKIKMRCACEMVQNSLEMVQGFKNQFNKVKNSPRLAQKYFKSKNDSLKTLFSNFI